MKTYTHTTSQLDGSIQPRILLSHGLHYSSNQVTVKNAHFITGSPSRSPQNTCKQYKRSKFVNINDRKLQSGQDKIYKQTIIIYPKKMVVQRIAYTRIYDLAFKVSSVHIDCY